MIDQNEDLRAQITKSYSSEEYASLLRNYAQEGKTTGEQKEDLIYYTKLNAQRSKRIAKTLKLDPNFVGQMEAIKEKQNWMLITESWCGDAANGVPIISALAQLNSNIDLKIVLRDENLELMDQFLTNGGRSIPKLIALDTKNEVLFTWGPRPKAAQDLYDSWKDDSSNIPYKEFQIELQKWYNADSGRAMQNELLDLLAR